MKHGVAFKTTARMVEVLTSGFDAGRCTDCGEKTLWGLQQFGYVDDDGCLTRDGRLVVMERMSLEDQCRVMELPFDEVEVESTANAEMAALDLFAEQGYIGACCEGGVILTFLKCLCLDTLAEFNPIGSRDDACVRFLEQQLGALVDHHDVILQSLRTASRENVVSNFDEVYSHRSIRERYPGLDREIMTGLYEALEVESLADVMQALMAQPILRNGWLGGRLTRDAESFRSEWPHLTLVRDREVRLVEVRTTEPLELWKLMGIPKWRGILPATFSVVRLRAPA